MKPNWRSRVVGWLGVLLLLTAIVVLFWFVPVIAAVIFAVIFVALTMLVAVAIGKADGFWNGLKFFIKEILFGW